MPSERCEVCNGRLGPVTHRCSGLDVPALAFCAADARHHALTCPDIRDGRSQMHEIEAFTNGDSDAR